MADVSVIPEADATEGAMEDIEGDGKGSYVKYIPQFIELADHLDELTTSGRNDFDSDPDEEEPPDDTGKQAYLAKCLELGLTPVSQVLKYLEHDDLHVAHYGLCIRGAAALAEALKVNKNLTTLRLADNHLGGSGCKVLCEALLQNHSTFRELDLSENHLGGADGALARAPLAKLLALKNGSLHSLFLRSNKLADQDAMSLAGALEVNRTVTFLDISNNLIGEKGGLAFGSLLHTDTKLKELNLGWNQLRSKGAAAIADGLRANSLVEVVNLGWNGLGDDGCTYIGEALANTATLVEIILSCNGAGTRGAVGVAEGMKVNESLASLEMDSNNINEEGGQAMKDALIANKGMVSLKMGNTNTSDELRESINTILKERRASNG